VAISRTEQGDLLIHPLPVDRGAELMNALLAFDEEFAAVLEEDRALQPIDQQLR
jgi:antitoxin VapB